MEAKHGTSVTNLIKLLLAQPEQLYVTDSRDHALRYANAQATGVVSADYGEQQQNSVILSISCDDAKWINRGESHNTLDATEAIVTSWKIESAIVRFSDYPNTLYGTRHTDYMDRNSVLEFLLQNGIEVQIID